MANKSNHNKSAESKAESVSPYSPAQIKKFFSEVQVEFSKITWPARKSTVGVTGIVVVLTIVLSAYLGAVDQLLGRLVSYILH